MTGHSKLSPSSAYRWLKCTASVNAIAQADPPETTSDAAEEGTRAHQLAALCLNLEKSPLTCEGEYDDVMRMHIVEYISYIKHLDFALYNTELELPLFYALNDMGTADVIGYCKNELHIIDLKYGQGVFVEVKDNPQLIIYAISALKKFADLVKINKVIVHIFQPRIQPVANIASWEYTLDELKGHEIRITEQAAKTSAINAEFSPSEVTCGWCPLKPTCKALDTHLTKIIGKEFASLDALKDIEAERMRFILDNKKLIISWLKGIEEHVLTTIQTGGSFNGYKVVKGKGSQSWRSIENLLALLQNEAYEKKILSPAKFKKFVNKHKDKMNLEQVKTIERDIIRQEGKETLVHMSHKKEAIEYLGFKKLKEYETEKKP